MTSTSMTTQICVGFSTQLQLKVLAIAQHLCWLALEAVSYCQTPHGNLALAISHYQQGGSVLKDSGGGKGRNM